jgi:hypothetical protein
MVVLVVTALQTVFKALDKLCCWHVNFIVYPPFYIGINLVVIVVRPVDLWIKSVDKVISIKMGIFSVLFSVDKVQKIYHFIQI